MWTSGQLVYRCLFFITVLITAVSSDDEDYDPCKAASIVQGDIAIEKLHLRLRRAATGHRGRLWKDGVIPYAIEIDYTGDQKATILQAMRHWEKFTCLSFVEKTDSDVDYIYFHKGRCGCCSFVGRKGNGRQGISIGKNCDKFGIVVHEIGHVVGFWHEHTRPDREKYVTILRENIKKGEEHNFQKLSNAEIDSRNEDYDYGSIMHYGKYTFSASLNHVTILPKRNRFTQVVPAIGQREKLSPGDIRQTQKMYRCTQCGKTLQEPTGTLSSPGFPRIYTANKHCEWRISVTPGERIVLNFTDFRIKKSKSCRQEFVEVRDGHGRKSSFIGRFCGKKVPPSIWSTGSRLWIKFKSGDQVTRPRHGFMAKYETRCGGPIRKSHGTIQSPKYPTWYPPNKECVWTIQLPSKVGSIQTEMIVL